jgi:hypothetical protein
MTVLGWLFVGAAWRLLERVWPRRLPPVPSRLVVGPGDGEVPCRCGCGRFYWHDCDGLAAPVVRDANAEGAVAPDECPMCGRRIVAA